MKDLHLSSNPKSSTPPPIIPPRPSMSSILTIQSKSPSDQHPHPHQHQLQYQLQNQSNQLLQQPLNYQRSSSNSSINSSSSTSSNFNYSVKNDQFHHQIKSPHHNLSTQSVHHLALKPSHPPQPPPRPNFIHNSFNSQLSSSPSNHHSKFQSSSSSSSSQASPPIPPPKPPRPAKYSSNQSSTLYDISSNHSIKLPPQPPSGPREWVGRSRSSSLKLQPSYHSLINSHPKASPKSPPNLFQSKSINYPQNHNFSINNPQIGLGLPSSSSKADFYQKFKLSDDDDDYDFDDSDEEEEEEEELQEIELAQNINYRTQFSSNQFKFDHQNSKNSIKPYPKLSRTLSGNSIDQFLIEQQRHKQHQQNHHAIHHQPLKDKNSTKIENIPDSTFANRRPPFLNNSRFTISIGSQFSIWSLRNNWLCASNLHQFKLCNILTNECINLINNNNNNNFQDLKITAMEFKNSSNQFNKNTNNNNQLIWFGTKDGQLLEFDCLERKILEFKSNLHSTAIVNLFRCKDGGMCSLDESSKVQIWSTNQSIPSFNNQNHHINNDISPSKSNSVKLSNPSRSQRIAEKTNFSKMLSHRLWTASGPSNSKSSNLSQRSPTIRVYDPDPNQPWTLTSRPLTIPETTTGDVIIGTVTAGAVIPSRPEIVYLGHDTGHVSVWEINKSFNHSHPKFLPSTQKNQFSIASAPEQIHRRLSITSPPVPSNGYNSNEGVIKFRKLIKLSNYQITAMEGVTKYLWVGFRTGNVYVYETEIEDSNLNQSNDRVPVAASWKVVKVWRAHKEAVMKIVVDPSVLWDEQVGKLHVATSSTDWKIRLWDGTMAVDWFSAEMKKRQAEYCTYRSIKTLVCSWNVDACKPNELVGTCDNDNFLEDVLKSATSGDDDLKAGRGPDVIVFGFQEMIDLENKKLTAKTVLLGGRKKGAEKLSDSVSQAYRKWHDRLVSAVKSIMPQSDPYVVVHTENLVGLFTCTFAKSSERAKMRDIAVTTVKTGMKGRYGNKGAILARFVIDDSSICFINCHLAAGQKHIRQRNEDLIDILEEKAGFPDPPPETSSNGVYVGGGNGSSIADHEICFLHGDLNFRIDARREDVIRAIAAGEYWKMLEHDQLIKEKKTNPLSRLRSFYEPPIRFHPTYKYDPGTHMYDSSEKERVPAWCDRILYRTPRESSMGTKHYQSQDERRTGREQSKEGSRAIVETINYRRYEVNVSDHRPISGTYRIWIKSIVPGLRRGIWEEVKSRCEAYEEDVKRTAMKYYSKF
ncbi:hypothetical protein O181_030702 [Austropuccinia psidii MF-1]|uniref:Inositol polyphosphate-related phosphatase domain-containing protein n=1 Tax=Austropuccinia psidii MF-1 TaxID=1389203 RepID=A0A9Q3CW90_9BASI|nr:hypothetical protein [Austropuccinia psidii MF-1]